MAGDHGGGFHPMQPGFNPQQQMNPYGNGGGGDHGFQGGMGLAYGQPQHPMLQQPMTMPQNPMLPGLQHYGDQFGQQGQQVPGRLPTLPTQPFQGFGNANDPFAFGAGMPKGLTGMMGIRPMTGPITMGGQRQMPANWRAMLPMIQ